MPHGGGEMANKKMIASVEQIESRIFLIRGQKVMLDQDLAELYGVETKRFNEQVRRNSERFPEPQQRAVPGRLHVSAHCRRICHFEVANCDLKQSSWHTGKTRRSQASALRFHRTRRHHGGQRT